MKLNKEVMKYTYDHFINKFEAIPEIMWITGAYFDDENPERKCALGHCDDHLGRSAEADALMIMVPGLMDVNDEISSHLSIKERVINHVKLCKQKDAALYA